MQINVSTGEKMWKVSSDPNQQFELNENCVALSKE